MLTGRLIPGSRLPSTRDIATQHHVARGTAVSAIEQLTAEGYLRAEVGSGTFVAHNARRRDSSLNSPEGPQPGPLRLSRRMVTVMEAGRGPDGDATRISCAFRANQPALDRFPWVLWNRIGAKVRSALGARLLMDQQPMGYGPLREEIARYLGARRSVRVAPEQVMVFSGTQQAMGVVASVLADAGDRAMVEDPGYPSARQACQFAGLTVEPVPVDDQGFDVGSARRRAEGVRVVYLTPAHQAPLGTAMTLSRRIELLQWATENDLWIFEDDYDGEFRFSGRPLPTLQSLDTSGRVLYAGTFSKALFPSLRLSFVVLPSALVEPFAVARWVGDRHTQILEQAVLSRFMAEGHFARHVRRMRTLYSERHTALLQIGREILREYLEIQPASSGLQTLALFRNPLDDRILASEALSSGVEVIPLSLFYSKVKPRRGFLMGFASVDSRDMTLAAQTLRRVFRSAAKK